MFDTESLSEFNFVLEFNFPKDISDNQGHIELPVHWMNVPLCTLSFNSMPVKSPGEIHCIAPYKWVKDAVLTINKWVKYIKYTYDNLHSISDSLLVEAKLCSYKNNQSLFKKWRLIGFHPSFNLYEYTDGNIKLVFKFENVFEEVDNKMYDISKYIKEYKDRNNKCEYCAYHNMIGGRCNQCEDHSWFVQEISLKQYVIRRVTEDAEKEFKESDEATQLNAKIYLRKNVYDDFNKYAEKQKEILDKELEDKHIEWSSLKNEYTYKMAKYVSDNIDKALASLESIND